MYLGEKKLANFKPSTTEKQKAKAAKPRLKREDREGNDSAHLAYLRKLPCCVTLKVPAGTVHHLKNGTGERGAGMRSSDKWGVPLAIEPHMELERQGSRNETRWFAERGIPAPLDLAAALYSASPDVAKGTAIVLAHKRGNK